ncbi:TPA: hypothetical protein ACIV5I_003845 [Salmonella enterica subsp. enterica serovar Java]|uniref:Uncharacterized protein n=1 Tax=Mixta hanseatica TaxID=2872648 RepID=A0ABY4RFI6_9GAMM|nr:MULTISPECIES: hypothetical protein [Enterobacterales]EAV7639298.1 hypothetical protein [Salmonella enterica]EBQ9931622.1 hypothetical protein [Salmonella enterica subsp. enterica serovar Java]ECQ0972460.1 hypothetical protein [Salmonella enterica subsp. enterica serovar Enteritidis]ECV8985850.1 hypothetical protein [Salmonella enterica subsp. enterica serovar Typhimurium]EDR7392355.1 hypothetical protein [Salmonella enterica subsp. enterica serovar Oranienburg]EDS2784791.1 hypothetical pro
MNKSKENENGYLVRNNWLLYVFAAFMVVSSQWMLATLEVGFKLPDILIYVVACVLLVYGGFLNMLAGTTTAIVFRIGFISILLFVAIGWLFKILGLY